jgi:nucleoside-diphosphate-sugar epimerase
VIVLLIGAQGQDGRYLKEIHETHGDRVIEVVKPSGGPVHFRENFYALDLTNRKTAARLFSSVSPDLIYHLATVHGSSITMNNVAIERAKDMYETHVLITENILEFLKESPGSKGVFALSSRLFRAEALTTVIDETSIPNPTDTYGITKLKVKEMVSRARETNEIQASCGILFNHTSFLSKEIFLFPTIAKAIKTRRNLNFCLSDWNTRVDMSYAYDICIGLYKLGKSKFSIDVVFGSEKLVYLPDLVQAVQPLVEYPIEFSLKKIERKDKPTLVSNCTLARKLLDWKPSIDATQLMLKLIKEER